MEEIDLNLLKRESLSLRSKPAKTEVFQAGQNSSPRKKCKKVFKETSENTTFSRTENTVQVERVHEVGEVVWAHMQKRWWPAVVIAGKKTGLSEAKEGFTWVFWFGDHRVSQIQNNKVEDFVEYFASHEDDLLGSKQLEEGVIEALQILVRRCRPDHQSFTKQQLYWWAERGFPIRGDKLKLYKPAIAENIPGFKSNDLEKINLKIREKKYGTVKMRDDKDSGISAVRQGLMKIEDICIACDDVRKRLVQSHPLFCGGLCMQCQEILKESIYVYDTDQSNKYCVICGSWGILLLCDNAKCSLSYCMECMYTLQNEELVKKIEEAENWQCFMCTPFTVETHGCLIPKQEWQRNVMQMFDSGYRIQAPDVSLFSEDGEKKSLRVLSLFDGICTGKLILDQLGVNVEVFYASEIEHDAILVTMVRQHNTIIQLGDVRNISNKRLNELGRIDLLIGGSPCNDLSIANPDRKGFSIEVMALGTKKIFAIKLVNITPPTLMVPTEPNFTGNGTGCLFFEFYRILTHLQTLARQQGHHLFWMFENVASMSGPNRDIISTWLKCKPALWDSIFFSPASRARYFWGNIPGMYSTPFLKNKTASFDMNDILYVKSVRTSCYKNIRCVTAKRQSTKQGKNEDRFPVQMNNQEDNLWINEVERLFGFPDHYTDVGNLSITRRHRLIGKAWSVEVVKEILSPLKQYFKTKPCNSGVKPN